MKVTDLIKALSYFEESMEVYIDLDDFKDLNLQGLEHIYQVNFKDGRKPILVLDADWGANPPQCLVDGEV